MKKLIAIDGNSLMHRAYYALPAMTTAEGVPTGALHGFLGMLLKLAAQKPDYLLVAFDMHGPTFRHESYAEYKAGRRETPEELRTQFPLLKTLLSEMGVAVCECPRYEADDILGTFARKCARAGVFALLVTGDRDALQLIDPTTHVLLTKRGVTDTVEYDEALLLETYGLTPDRMRDLKGLMGDNSDNIPGVPGVGEKTALKLLAEYGDIENVLSHAGEVRGKLSEKLLQNAESARMSYEIGTICTEAPVTMALSDCVCAPTRFAGARAHLNELELRAIASRLPEGGAPAPETLDAPKTRVMRLTSMEDIRGILEKHVAAERFSLDVQDALTFAFDSAVCYRVEPGGDLFSAGLDTAEALSAFAPFFRDGSKTLLTFDSKRLRHMLAENGMELCCRVFDAMIADYLLHANRPAGTLAALAEQTLHVQDCSAATLFALHAPMTGALAAADMEGLYRDMELPLSKVLFDMERTGFAVDDRILMEMQAQLTERVNTLAADIYEAAGGEFNILSPKQLGDVLFNKLALPTQRKTKSGFSTDADTLEALASQHPVVPLVLEYRFLTKLKSTFVDGLLAVRSPADGRVRTRFNQCVTATGRISSTEPNLQNIPVRTELGREIRKAFVASPGCTLVGADYSQIELRLLAHISGDSAMVAAFNSGKDIHRTTAGEVFGVPFDEVTNEMRSAAKAVNFGIVYGISDFGLAKNLNIPVRRAREYIELYFARYPGVKAYLTESVRIAKERGYAVTVFNRRRAMPELNSGNYNTRSFGERVAMNMPIQGAAADIIKLAMVRASEALIRERLSAKLILQVHDELIFDTPIAETEAVMRLARDSMENVASLSVPLIADVKTGESWYDTK